MQIIIVPEGKARRLGRKVIIKEIIEEKFPTLKEDLRHRCTLEWILIKFPKSKDKEKNVEVSR